MVMMSLAFTSLLWAQRTVTGKITSSEDGSPVPGANILEKGTSNGAITDIDGNYRITVGDGATLVFSFIGFSTQEVAVGNQSSVDVALDVDVQALNEVVVTAFGIEKEKKALGYAVTQVDGEDFTESRTLNLGTALTGKIAGVNVSSPTTGAAGSSRVIIRGGSSLSGNDQPLYIVNGVPIDNTTLGSAGLWGGNDNGDGLTSLNPDDIESMSVLKGNTAAALYGARAANGVILITTKGGRAQQGITVSFNSNFTVDQAYDLTDYQDQYGHGADGQAPTNQDAARDFGQSSWGGRLNGSSVIQFDGVSRPYSDVGEGINDFYRNGTTWTNTLALSGGNDVVTYRFSASDLANNDIMPNSGFDRQVYSADLNMNSGKLSSRVNVQYSNENALNRPRLSDTPGNANSSAFLLPQTISYETLKGTTDKLGAMEDGFELQHQGNVFAQNPYWAAYQFYRRDIKDRVLGSALLRYDILDWLYVQGRIGTDLVSWNAERTEAYGTAYKPRGDFNTTSRKIRENNVDILVGATQNFGPVSADILVGGNRMRRSDESIRIGGNDLDIPFFHSVNNVNGANRTYSYGFSEWGINSVFGSVSLAYENFLFLNITGRQDAFSTLSRDDNKVFYPSVGLSFVLSDALALPSVFTFAKIRTSWAQAGGGAPNPYALNLTYSLGGASHNGASLGSISNGSIPNQGLTPYLSTEIEFGFDVRLFDNRVGLDMAVYQRTTEDDILNTSISGTSGFGSTTINVGELQNRGIELLLNVTPVQTTNFTWDLSFNMANNISEVKSLGTNAAGDPIDFLNLDEARTRQERIRHYVGEQLGSIAGYKHRTINGQLVYDANGFPVRSEGFEILGNGRHPFSGGIRNTFNYKGVELDVLIDIRAGGQLYSGTNVILYSVGLHQETLVGRETGLSVSGVDVDGNPLTVEIPADQVDNYYGAYNDITDYFVYDAGFGQLRQLTLGYNLPQSVIGNTPFKSVKLSFVGRNLLLLWSDVDNIHPESAYSNGSRTTGLEYFAMPATRSFGFNLGITL